MCTVKNKCACKGEYGIKVTLIFFLLFFVHVGRGLYKVCTHSFMRRTIPITLFAACLSHNNSL